MSPLSIYTALNVPAVTSHPSAKCLQWSSDGQVFFVTKNAVHILTPDPGINFDTSSVTKATIEEGERPLGWFKTMIELNKGHAYNWPDGSQDWSAVSLGSLDVTLRATVSSPSNMTAGAGCVLATLSSNMDLSLWIAAKNNLKGEWTKIQDVTIFLIELFSQDHSQSATAKTLQAQITSITWSPQTNFGITPTPRIDGSLLVAGNRAGSLIFLRLDGNMSVQHVRTIIVAEVWVTHLAFSPWTVIETGKCEAYLAFGSSDGCVGLLRIIQSAQPKSSVSTFEPEYDIQILFEIQNNKPYEADQCGITALEWLDVPERSRVLVHCKPGLVHLWSPPDPAGGWFGHRTFVLENQKLSVGSSSFHPVSGIHYVRHEDALVISLFDGSFHVIHDLTHEPSWSSQRNADLTSEKLSMVSRSVFIRVEQGDMGSSDMNRISGMVSYDGSATTLWLHEAGRPRDFSYKHDARHNSMFIMAQMWGDSNDNMILRELAEVLHPDKTASGQAPIHLLRPSFLHLRQCGKLSQLHSHVLEILSPHFVDHSINVVLLPWSGALVPEVRREFKRSLARHLFGWDTLLSLRMRLSVADFSWKHSKDTQKQAECGRVAQTLLNAISHCVLRTLIRHLAAIVTVLTPSDIPFVFRIVVQSLLPNSPPDLSTEAERLSEMMHTASLSNGLNERCPACDVEVPLQDITSAVCSNGHAWARCSITSFILATPMVRTCISCRRKAFLPLSICDQSGAQTWLPIAAQSWIVEDLLEAVQRCLFCGNNFVTIL